MEYTTLARCFGHLEAAIQSDVNGIAGYLYDEAVITRELHEEVLDPKSTCPDAAKAAKIVLQVMEKVKMETRNFYKLVNHLRQDKKYGDVVCILDAEYFGVKDLSADTENGREMSN